MEQNNCCRIMNDLVSHVEKLNYPTLLSMAEENFDLKEFKIGQISPAYASQIYRDIYIKFMKNYSPKTQLNWGENELRLFVWILMCYLPLKSAKIQELGQEDWEYFCTIFPNKQPILFEYQTKSLMNDPIPSKKWTTEEDELFSILVKNKDNKYKWSELAKELYIRSNRYYYRTPKQCRQRWLNHLDPNKSKDEWQLRQDFILISHVFSKGKKWAEISKLLKNRRNEHSIKNRFKSLITKEQKLHPQPQQQAFLIEVIYKKYDNHFSKLRLMNTINNLSNNEAVQQVKASSEEDIPMVNNTNHRERDIIGKQTFQILKSSLKSGAKTQHQTMPSGEIYSQNMVSIPSFHSVGFLDAAVKEERQKEIRADMFLSTDPFDFLKQFFKSKDNLTWYE